MVPSHIASMYLCIVLAIILLRVSISSASEGYTVHKDVEVLVSDPHSSSWIGGCQAWSKCYSNFANNVGQSWHTLCSVFRKLQTCKKRLAGKYPKIDKMCRINYARHEIRAKILCSLDPEAGRNLYTRYFDRCKYITNTTMVPIPRFNKRTFELYARARLAIAFFLTASLEGFGRWKPTVSYSNETNPEIFAFLWVKHCLANLYARYIAGILRTDCGRDEANLFLSWAEEANTYQSEVNNGMKLPQEKQCTVTNEELPDPISLMRPLVDYNAYFDSLLRTCSSHLVFVGGFRCILQLHMNIPSLEFHSYVGSLKTQLPKVHKCWSSFINSCPITDIGKFWSNVITVHEVACHIASIDRQMLDTFMNEWVTEFFKLDCLPIINRYKALFLDRDESLRNIATIKMLKCMIHSLENTKGTLEKHEQLLLDVEKLKEMLSYLARLVNHEITLSISFDELGVNLKGLIIQFYSWVAHLLQYFWTTNYFVQ